MGSQLGYGGFVGGSLLGRGCLLLRCELLDDRVPAGLGAGEVLLDAFRSGVEALGDLLVGGESRASWAASWLARAGGCVSLDHLARALGPGGHDEALVVLTVERVERDALIIVSYLQLLALGVDVAVARVR